MNGSTSPVGSNAEKSTRDRELCDDNGMLAITLNEAFPHFFDFMQDILRKSNGSSLADLCTTIKIYLTSKEFTSSNYWLRLSQDLSNHVHYAVDYFIGNCPSSYYPKSFRRIVTVDDDEPMLSIKWVGPSQNSEILLKWFDLWWSHKLSPYSARRPVFEQPHRETGKYSVRDIAERNVRVSAKHSTMLSAAQPFSDVPENSCDSSSMFDNEDFVESTENLDVLNDGTSCFGDYLRGSDDQHLQLNFYNMAGSQSGADSLDTLSRFDAHSPLPMTSSYLQDSEVLSYLDRIEEQDECQAFHQMEFSRFASPFCAFTYNLPDGSSVVVGPIIGNSISLFNHISNYEELRENLLDSSAKGVSNVYIVDLVRDAVARLPGGFGTRVDICKLFKQSQFLNASFISDNDCLINGLVGKCLEILSDNQIQRCVEFVINHTGKSLWHYISYSDSEPQYLVDELAYPPTIPEQSRITVSTESLSSIVPRVIPTQPSSSINQSINSELKDFLKLPERGRPKKRNKPPPSVKKPRKYRKHDPGAVLLLNSEDPTGSGKRKAGDVIVEYYQSESPPNLETPQTSVYNRDSKPSISTGFSVAGFGTDPLDEDEDFRVVSVFSGRPSNPHIINSTPSTNLSPASVRI